jgi:hypothetical protein
VPRAASPQAHLKEQAARQEAQQLESVWGRPEQQRGAQRPVLQSSWEAPQAVRRLPLALPREGGHPERPEASPAVFHPEAPYRGHPSQAVWELAPPRAPGPEHPCSAPRPLYRWTASRSSRCGQGRHESRTAETD